MVKTQYITADERVIQKRPNIRAISFHIAKTEGVSGFYKGAVLSMVGLAPFIAIRMSTYDSLMTTFQSKLFKKQQIQDRDLTYLMFNCAVGSFSGLAATAIYHPIDTVRRVLHLNG